MAKHRNNPVTRGLNAAQIVAAIVLHGGAGRDWYVVWRRYGGKIPFILFAGNVVGVMKGILLLVEALSSGGSVRVPIRALSVLQAAAQYKLVSQELEDTIEHVVNGGRNGHSNR